MIVTILIKILSKTCASEKNTNQWKQKNENSARETKYSNPWKNRKIVPVKKKSVREKNRKKCAWKTLFAREKIQKTEKNGFHGHFFFSRGKKKHCIEVLSLNWLMKSKYSK